MEIQSIISLSITLNNDEASQASRGSGAPCACKLTGCGFDPYSRRGNIYLHLYFHFFALMSRGKRGVEFRHSTRNASRKWGTECLNTRFPLHTLLCMGYSVKLREKTNL